MRKGAMALAGLALSAVTVSVVVSGPAVAKGGGKSRAAAAAATCDRACLSGFITRYFAAMAAHDARMLPVTSTVRFTENGVAIPLGDGLWNGFSGLGDFRQDYVDTQAQQVAAIVAFGENGKPGMMSLRLKIVGGKIAEVETVLNRTVPEAMNMQPSEPIWNETEAAPARLTRAQLAAGAEGYTRAIAASDSKYVRFNSKSCIRFENSTVMAMLPTDTAPGPLMAVRDPNEWAGAVAKTIPGDCGKQIDTGIYRFITSYNGFRAPVIDVERQVVFGQWNFRRRGQVKGVTMDGKFYPFGAGMRFPNENLLGQAFKFRDGGITRVRGVFLNANVYMSGTGWPGGHDGPVAMDR